MLEQQLKINASKQDIPQGPPNLSLFFGLIDGTLQPKIIRSKGPRLRQNKEISLFKNMQY